MYPASSLRTAHRGALGDVAGAAASSPAMPLAIARGAGEGDDDGIAVTRTTIPEGDGGARATVAAMVDLIRHGSASPIVRGQAIAIIRNTRERDYAAQITRIRSWVAQHVVFLRDPDGTELLHAPELMVRSIAENRDRCIHVDCDDVAILAGALGVSIGLRCRIVTVAFRDPSAPRSWLERLTGFDAATPFAHTWSELASPVDSPQWAEMDTTRGVQGVDPSFIARSFVVDV